MGYKMKGSPAKLGTIQGTSGYRSAVKQKQQSKLDRYTKLKEWLITERGFNQADADRMIKSGAYSFEDIKKESINKGRPNTKGKSPAKQYSTKIGPAEKPGTTEKKRKAMMEASFKETMSGEKARDYKKSADYEKNKKSPAKQKTYPPSYTKEDIEFLKKQREDIVRYEDLDEKGKAIWKKQGKPVPNKTKTKTKNKKSDTKVKQKDWEPAYPGADYSKEEIANMTEEQKKAKIDGYESKNKKPKNKK